MTISPKRRLKKPARFPRHFWKGTPFAVSKAFNKLTPKLKTNTTNSAFCSALRFVSIAQLTTVLILGHCRIRSIFFSLPFFFFLILPCPSIVMDQRELETRIKALTKSVAANEAPENALRLLDSLKKDAAPTEEMLRVR